MKLFHRDLSPSDLEPGAGASRSPLVILHGLYGSSRNWSRVGSKLARATGRSTFALDLRNHGASPWSDTMSYSELARDVIEWLDDHAIEHAVLVGHSLGGKTAMAVACGQPERVAAVVVVDIAPRVYRPDERLLDALLAVDLGRVAHRSEVEDQILEAIPDSATRLFLLTNLVRDEADSGGSFRWQANLPGLRRSLSRLGESPIGPADRFEGPAAFLVGGRSSYVGLGDSELIRSHFPQARIVSFENSGHNVHVEGGDEFVEEVQRTLPE